MIGGQTGPALEIRPATVDDVDDVAQVHVEAWRSGYASLMPADYLASLDWEARAATWRQHLENPSAGVGYLVAARGAVLGFAAFGPVRDQDLADESVGEIYALNVHSSSWSTGAGSALLLAALRALGQYDAVVLWVLAENRRARRFYERHGFRLDGARKLLAVADVDLPELRYRRLSRR